MKGLGLAGTLRARLRSRRPWLAAIPAAVLIVTAASATAGGDGVSRAAGTSTLAGGVVLFSLLVGGWVGDELRSGAALFWIQTPRSPVLLYGARFATVTGATLLVVACVGLSSSALLAVLGRGDAAMEVVRSVPGLVLGLLVLGTLIWFAGAWGVRGDGWAGILLGIALAFVELVARLRPEWLGPLATPADLVGLPLDDLASAAALLAGSAGGPEALARVTVWWAVVTALGALGLTRSVARSDVGERAG